MQEQALGWTNWEQEAVRHSEEVPLSDRQQKNILVQQASTGNHIINEDVGGHPCEHNLYVSIIVDLREKACYHPEKYRFYFYRNIPCLRAIRWP